MKRRSEAIVATLGAVVLAGCVGYSVHAHTAGETKAGSAQLGAVPIAEPQAAMVRTVRAGRFALLSMGDTVTVVLANGNAVQLTGLGPAFPSPRPDAPPPTSGVGQMQVAITGEKGVVTLNAGQFIGTNENGQAVRLRSTGPARVTVRPGQKAELRLSGMFITGDGALTYLPAGRPAVTWDFNVELD